MAKQLREQMTVAEQKDLLRLIINGEVQTTLDIMNSLPSDLTTRSKNRLARMFERALPTMSYVRKDSEYIVVFETPEQVVERLERAMNEILRRNNLAYINVRHLQVEKDRVRSNLNEYLQNGECDINHIDIAENEIKKIEQVITQLYDDCDTMAIEYAEISSIKNKMAEILNEK